MSAYLQQEFDFVKRTKLIFAQYESASFKDKYEVTLLLNCFVGLLILPQQYWFKYLPADIINQNDWGIDPSNILFIKTGEIKSVANIAKHLRNSVAHYRFKAFASDKSEISEINFQDFDGNIKSFEATIPVNNLKLFVNQFSDFMLEKMEAAK